MWYTGAAVPRQRRNKYTPDVCYRQSKWYSVRYSSRVQQYCRSAAPRTAPVGLTACCAWAGLVSCRNFQLSIEPNLNSQINRKCNLLPNHNSSWESQNQWSWIQNQCQCQWIVVLLVLFFIAVGSKLNWNDTQNTPVFVSTWYRSYNVYGPASPCSFIWIVVCCVLRLRHHQQHHHIHPPLPPPYLSIYGMSTRKDGVRACVRGPEWVYCCTSIIPPPSGVYVYRSSSSSRVEMSAVSFLSPIFLIPLHISHNSSS